MLKKNIVSFALALFLLPPFFLASATEGIQLLNSAELIAMHSDQARELHHSIKQYQMVFKNKKELPDLEKERFSKDILSLTKNINTARKLGELDQKILAGRGGKRVDGQSFSAINRSYTKWNKQNQASLREVYRSASLDQNLLEDETKALSILMNQLQSASGQKSLLQVFGQISAMQVVQMQRLRSLNMDSTKLQMISMNQEKLNAEKKQAQASVKKRKDIEALKAWFGADGISKLPPARTPDSWRR